MSAIGTKRTQLIGDLMSANDPKRTFSLLRLDRRDQTLTQRFLARAENDVRPLILCRAA